jgi:amino acid adenylation domain-containing protein
MSVDTINSKELKTRFQSVQELFSVTAARLGNAVAVDRMVRRISYAELESRSNQLANVLLAQEVVKGSLVGILAEDPIEVISSILGILKAGAVFVPLDPSFPEKRLQVMAAQVNCGWFVLESKFQSRLEQIMGTEVSVRTIHVDGEELKRQSQARPEVESQGDDACSIYFTSGSTGKPKAILGRLKGMDHFARWEAAALGIGGGTRVSQLASPCFDGFLKDVFVPLCAGGVVCAPESRQVVLEPERLIDWVDVEGVEVLHCVPSVLRSLLNEGLDAKYFSSLRWVVLAGEALLPADVKRWVEVFGERIRLVNLYGPTETTVTKLCYFVEAADAERPSVPIGKPIPGADVLVVNSKGKPSRPGVAGEIYIRTPYRSLGYYNAPELTNEAFVPNPFSKDPTDLVYKTGDYGRLLEDGNLEFLGRRDQQVKVRGVRVELGEIENLLRRHAEVKDVAVIDREDGSGNKYLCAYVVLGNGTGAGTLREYLAAQLPEFMVPSGFVEMKELPRTLNGKIDRKALPALEEARREKKTEVRPRTPVEEIVAGIWSEVLRVRQVGVEENFFELGGHSLLATQIISRIRESLHVELPLRALFESPRLSDLARRIEQEGKAEQGKSETVPLRRVSREEDLPLSYSQQRMWMLEQLSAGSAAFNLPLGMKLRGWLNVNTLEQTFGEVIRRHEVLRTSFPARDGQPIQVIAPPAAFSLPLVDLSALEQQESEAALKRIASEDAARPFDLAQGPLVRTALLRQSGQQWAVVCTMHHLVGDAWSFEVLTSELSRLYASFSAGEPSPLPPLAIQYADYAVWQRQWLQGEVLESRLNYWRQQLKGAPERLKLPQSRRRQAAVQSFRGARQRVEISPELTEGLRALSRHEGATLYMTMLTAFVVLLYQYTGEEDVVVGSVIANRERGEVEKLIGFLANTLVLRVELSGGGSLRELLGRVRESCLGAYANQLPPEKLQEETRGGSGGQRMASLFDVWFQMESVRREKLELAEVEMERLEAERGNARFELSLVLQEDEHQVSGEMEYDADLFDQKTIAQMLEHMRNILSELVMNPEGSIVGISLSRETESEPALAFTVDLEV